tara:strand:- start:68 stop:913 length:846 start_codon:yes stop_codon:yes gene_type:complete
MKALKTPLRYPGGKSRACVKLEQYLPDLNGYKEFREPFIGGGSVALHLTKKYPDISIWVNDLYEPLINFWKELQYNGERLQGEILDLKKRNSIPEDAKNLFEDSKKYLSLPLEKSLPLWRAVSFYIVNKCSFSGLTESSSFSKQASESNFSIRGIEKLVEYSKLIEDWKITNSSYEDLLTDWNGAFIYLDPPYDIKDNLYGRKGGMHKKFDHDKFAEDCDNSVAHQLISYNSSQLVKNRFKNWNVAEFSHTYTMRSVGQYMSNQQDRKELVLFNYRVESNG